MTKKIVMTSAVIGTILAALTFGSYLLATESVTRINTNSSGNQATDGYSGNPSISADGRYVAFDSNATNLVSGDTNERDDVFLKDTQTGIATRISTDSTGSEGTGGGSFSPSIAADGRYVAFYSSANNLVNGDTNGFADIFSKDTQTGAITRVSTDSSGAQANYGSSGPSTSSDARYITFHSFATNLVIGDTNQRVDVFHKDTQTGVITRVSTSSTGTQALNGDSFDPAISTNGRFVAFTSYARNLVADDTNNLYDIFLKDTQKGTTTRVSTDSDGNQASGGSNLNPAISSDGRYIAFYSDSNNLVSGDTNGRGDIFLKDTQTGVTTRVSTDSSGSQVAGVNSIYPPSISTDGRYVAFYSYAPNLVPGDTNDLTDVFIKDTRNGTTARMSTDSSGNQAIGGESIYPVISADGRYMAFLSDATNLINGDTNNLTDIFLRVDTTGPTVNSLTSSTHPSSSSYYSNNDPSFSFRATDISGISGYSYEIDRSAATIPDERSDTTSTTVNFNNLADGTWYFHLRAVDIFDNWNPASHYQINIDTKLPSLTFNPLDTNQYYKGGILLEASSSDSLLLSGINRLEFYQGNTLLSSTNQDSATYTWNSSNHNGAQTLTVKSIDLAGNQRSSSQTINVDNEAPTVNSSLSENKYYRGQINMLATAIDNLSGVKKIWLYNGDFLLTNANTDSASYALDSSSMNGRNKITIKSSDNVGNEHSITQIINVDNYKPRTSAPRKAKVKKGKKVKLYYKVEDPYSGGKATVVLKIKKKVKKKLKKKTKWQYKIVKSINLGLVDITNLGSTQFKAKLAKGKYKFFIGATDQAGNTQENIASNWLVVT